MGGLPWSDVKKNVDLLGGGVGSAFGGDARAVIAIFLHELANILHGAVEFVASVRLSQLQFGSVNDLIVVGMTGGAFNVDGADKEVERRGEYEHHTRT